MLDSDTKNMISVMLKISNNSLNGIVSGQKMWWKI